MTHKSERVLSVTELSRVEGEGALYVRTVGDRVEEARLDIYEPPRFFEAFLRGRAYTEPPDITARICGICPVAYQMSACAAIEDACGVTVPEQVTALRRLLYCGEWIESHALHIYLLHAPDFLGYASGIEMASHRRDLVERGLQLKKAGNAVMEAVGGRAIHPVNVRLGGFYRAPARAELTALTEPLKRALDGALETVRWVAGFDFPDHACDADLLALTHPGTYAIERGTLATRSGLAFPAARFDEQVIEEHVPHSTALHAHLAGGGRYLTGPLARYALGSRWLSPLAREAARAAGLGETCDNPFRSIVVRAVETVYAVEEALRLIAAYEPPEPAAVEVPSRAATGYGVTEAPRGTLYHRYQIGADGLITAARIVPPTSQNQAAIEADLATFVQAHLDLDDAELTRRCEQAIRNYDPCISCSAHFLDLTVERSLSGRTILVHAPAATHADRGDLGPGDSGPRLLAARPLAGWAEGSMPEDVMSMRALVVYESMYGNTHVVASNIADGLRGNYEVTLVPVAEATSQLIAGADLLVAGGPTHMHGLSSASSRKMAAEAAAKKGSGLRLDPDACGPGLRDWLRDIDRGDGLAAAFDTRLAGVPAFTGRAGRGISRLLKRRGYQLVAAPASFLVSPQSTLLDGEASRARRWGMTLGAASKTYVPATAER